MTCVAVRAGIMAADTQSTFSNMKSIVPKLARFPDMIIGGAGTVTDRNVLIEWYVQGANRSDPPRFTVYGEKPDVNLLVLYRDGTVRYVDHWLNNREIKEAFFAIGSGCEAAMGAMYMGADARRAVEIAALVDVNTGGPIETMFFAEGE